MAPTVFRDETAEHRTGAQNRRVRDQNGPVGRTPNSAERQPELSLNLKAADNKMKKNPTTDWHGRKTEVESKIMTWTYTQMRKPQKSLTTTSSHCTPLRHLLPDLKPTRTPATVTHNSHKKLETTHKHQPADHWHELTGTKIPA